MLSHPSIDALLPEEKSAAIQKMATDLREGKISPTDIYVDVLEERESSRMFSGLTWGAAAGLGLAGFSLASGGGAAIAVLCFGGATGGLGWISVKRWLEFKEDVRDDLIGDWLNDDEWEDLENLCQNVPDSASPRVKEKAQAVLEQMHADPEEEELEPETDPLEAEYEILELEEEEEVSWVPKYQEKQTDHKWELPDGAPGSIFDENGVSPEFLAKSKQERAEIFLDELKKAGCDIEQFVGDRMIGATGNQGSGKSTILMILSIIESAMKDKRITYVTCDDDIYPVKFDRIHGGELMSGKAGYLEVISEIEGLKKGQARDRIWFLDECTKTLRKLGEKKGSEPLWNNLLTGFAKTGGSVRMVMHGKTATSMGIPKGDSETAKAELIMLGALWARNALEDGEYVKPGKYPSGVFHVLEASGHSYEATGEVLTLPKWLQFVMVEGREGNIVPCYVHSTLELFPELDARLDNSDVESPDHVSAVDDNDIEEWVGTLERVANEIRKQCAPETGVTDITARMAAQCFNGKAEREKYYPEMDTICRALQSMYPTQFKVFYGKASELRIAFLPATTHEVSQDK